MLKDIWETITSVYSGLVLAVLIIGFVLLIFLLGPMLIGWGFHYLLAFVRGEPEITGFWCRVLTGYALGLVGYCFYGIK